jgi:hypothetical protein
LRREDWRRFLKAIGSDADRRGDHAPDGESIVEFPNRAMHRTAQTEDLGCLTTD